MTPIEQKFAEFIGQILGQRWFNMQQANKDAENETRLHILPCDGSNKRHVAVKNRSK